MNVDGEVTIKGTREAIWAVISDMENAARTIGAIEKVEMIEKPESGLVGLKWTETRTMFGKTATETMWITEAEEGSHYKTRAESHGCVYISGMSISGEGETHTLRMDFEGRAQTFMAKIMSGLMGWMFKGSMRKAILQDLNDVKAAVEKAG